MAGAELQPGAEEYAEWKAPEIKYADGDKAVEALAKMSELDEYAGLSPDEIAQLPNSAQLVREAYPQLGMLRTHYAFPGANRPSTDRLPTSQPNAEQKFYSSAEAVHVLQRLAAEKNLSLEQAAMDPQIQAVLPEKIEDIEALDDPEREAKRTSLERWYRNPERLSADELLDEIRQDGVFIAHFTGAGQRIFETGEIQPAGRVAQTLGEERYSRGSNLGFKSYDGQSVFFSLNRNSNLSQSENRVGVHPRVLDPSADGNAAIDNQTVVFVTHPAILATRNRIGVNMRETAGAAESILEVRGGLRADTSQPEGLPIEEFVALVPENVIVDLRGIPVHGKDGKLSDPQMRPVQVDYFPTNAEVSAFAARGEHPVISSKVFWEATVARLELEEGKPVPKSLIFTKAEDHQGMIREFQETQNIPSQTNFPSLEGKLALVDKVTSGADGHSFVSYPQPNQYERQHVPMDITRESLDFIQGNPDHTPRDILDFIARDKRMQLGKLLEASSGTWEGYSIGQHTEMVMGQFQKYFSGQPLPAGMRPEVMELTLALHDIGKSIAKSKQHEETIRIMAPFLRKLKFSEEEVTLATTLVDGDPLGKFIAGASSAEDSAAVIRANAGKVGVSPEEFLELQRMYFISDAGAYTEDAGGKKSLDHVFLFDSTNRTASLAPAPAQKYDELRKLLAGPGTY